MENKKNYYSVLYKATYPDSGVISYKPLKVIKGFYDEEQETFEDVETGNIYNCVNMSIPTFGKDQDNIVTALSSEIVEYDGEDPEYFSFPIEESKLIEYCEAGPFEGIAPEEVYEREVRSYFLYSVYDEEIDDNIFYLADKLEDHTSYNIDVSLDIVDAVSDSKAVNNNQNLLMIVAGGLQEMIQNGELELDIEGLTEPQAQGAPKCAEDSVLTPIVHDFDPDKLEEEVKAEVMGQDHVVNAVVSTLYRNKKYHEHDGLKSNIAIFGPSGCGKTEIIRSVSRHLDIPITVFDATTATASGFVGTSVTQCIKDLIQVCNGDVAKAEHGIIVIDEFDKLAQQGAGESVNKGDVQNELFKMLEGDEITIAADSYKEQSFRFNPKNVTFICIGSGQALIDSKKEEGPKRLIGFRAYTEEPKKEEKQDSKEIILEPADLIKFGIKPELLRRLSVIKVVNQLGKDDLVNILTNSRISNLKIYEKAFQDVDGVKIVYDRDILETIVDKSTEEKAGASGLKRVVDDMMQVAVRKIRLLEGQPGELELTKDTITDSTKFRLYRTDGANRVQVYPQEEVKVKKLGSK